MAGSATEMDKNTPAWNYHLCWWCRIFSTQVSHSTLCRHSADPLKVLLVVIVPTIVPLKYVSTTLGVHKAVSATRYRDIRTVTSSHLTVGEHWVYYISNAFWDFTR